MRLKCSPWLLLASFIVFIATGCEEKLSPVEVSTLFWKGVEQRDVTVIRKFTSSDSHVDISATENTLPVKDATFGKTVIEADRARVDTTVTVISENPFALPLTTVLVMENGYWKVKYDKTVASISSGSDIARIVQGIQDLGDKFMGGLDQSMGEIQSKIPEIKQEIEKVEEELKSRIPELKKRMEEFTRQLEEALKLPPESSPEPAPEQKEAIEI